MKWRIVSCDSSAVLSNRGVLWQVSSEEVSDDLRSLLRMLEQEHVATALDLAQFPIAESLDEGCESFC